jgi:hypothetical protein
MMGMKSMVIKEKNGKVEWIYLWMSWKCKLGWEMYIDLIK